MNGVQLICAPFLFVYYPVVFQHKTDN